MWVGGIQGQYRSITERERKGNWPLRRGEGPDSVTHVLHQSCPGKPWRGAQEAGGNARGHPGREGAPVQMWLAQEGRQTAGEPLLTLGLPLSGKTRACSSFPTTASHFGNYLFTPQTTAPDTWNSALVPA